jgi:hypothetical protein
LSPSSLLIHDFLKGMFRGQLLAESSSGYLMSNPSTYSSLMLNPGTGEKEELFIFNYSNSKSVKIGKKQ